MALVEPVIFQVVGYQNSGKTTFLVKLIQILTEKGLRTVTIKHHGHGGKPEVGEEKDSSRHFQAGAYASLVEGDGLIVLQAEGNTWFLEEQIQLMKFFSPDIIFIEGHKQKPYPKLVFLKDEKDFGLLTAVNNVSAIVVWNEELIFKVRKIVDIPVYHIDNANTILQISLTLKQLIQEKNKMDNSVNFISEDFT
jgi:molybdopterin-guanine dinucleotide biosynthesis adapter protein